LLSGIVVLTVFDITLTVLDVIAQCGIVFGYYLSYNTLSCAMTNPGAGGTGKGVSPGGTGQGVSPGGTGQGVSPGVTGQGVNPGGNTGGGEAPRFITEQEAHNHTILMNRHGQGQVLARYEYALVFRHIVRMEAQAN
jgi:hypothetical protein